ncbi:siderophore-interacting protein [Rhodovulum sulfidophilum]|uniref:siderophore-interacting protein n=1 Tax=Rhodovulum sulfidophilum TaxID=35806 RepID=UPI001F260DCE|nr:siderophore-interacting protein [Rhodovulum sulfidophilum]MCE8438523.1 siderophore-interacting protein [Rhodovulum sulfidophilum]
MSGILPIAVKAVRDLSPSMMRLVFEVDGFERLQPTPHPDEWVSLWFPDATGALPRPLPRALAGPSGGRLPRARSRPYSLRRIDPVAGTVTIDIVRHEGGLAAGWAARARPGDRLLMSQPEGRFRLPAGAGRVLVFADITGLPALARIVETLPPRVRLSAEIALPCPGDRPDLPLGPGARLRWHPMGDAAHLPCPAEAFVPGRDYVWIAAEAAVVAGLKRHFLGQGATARDLVAIGYWIRGRSRR